MWGSLHQRLLYVCKQQESKGDIVELLWERTAQLDQLRMWQPFHQSLCNVCAWRTTTTCHLHRLKLSTTISMSAGCRKSEALVREAALDSGEDCRWKLSTTSGAHCKQCCRYWHKNTEQAEVVLPFAWVRIGLHHRLHKGWCRWVCSSEWKDGTLQTTEANYKGDSQDEHSHGYSWGSWAYDSGCGSSTMRAFTAGLQT